MATCPRCSDEYEAGVVACAVCGLRLDAAPGPAVDALLGTFDPAVADRVLALLRHRAILHDAVAGPDGVEVVVDRPWRDDLRAELTLRWPELLARLDDDVRSRLGGGPQPGWRDPPAHVWADRAGRLRVDAADDEDADATRRWGPAATAVGALLLVFAWYSGVGGWTVVVGAGLLVAGPLLPR